MQLSNILNTENINIDQLQKGLKHIGFNLSRFAGVAEEQIPGLLKLFKIAVDIDPKTSTKFTKMDLRSKLEKVLKGQPINNHSNTVAAKGVTEKKVRAGDQQKNNHQNSNVNRQPQLSSINKKLGKVKFFDSTNGFGYVHSFTDNKDCFIHVSKLITSGIVENDIVIFETVASKKKPGELDAIKVSNKIPVFIFNKDSSSESFAYPLLDNQLEKEIALIEKYETGFAKVTAHYRESSWRTLVIPSEIIQKAESISFGKVIIVKLLPNLDEHKKAIEWLTSLLLQLDPQGSEINSIYRDRVDEFEQKSIPEINKKIASIKDVSFFKPFIEEKKKTLNKISLVLWAREELQAFPGLSLEEELNIWHNEILPSLSSHTLQKILEKLFSEQGDTVIVKRTFEYLVNKGWEIDNIEELERIELFLIQFKTVFPDIQIKETHFRCEINRFYIELYNKQIIKELSETCITQYIEELKTDDEKAAFIEKLQPDKILSYYFSFPSLSNYQEKYIAGILESEFSKIDFLCFDLESDGDKINEFAWKNRLGVKSESDFKKLEDGIAELVTLINSSSLIIGQNITEFDLSVLANHGASPSSDFIWDTLDIEMLLNPERFSYGLKSQHSAASDTELTYRLFKNQYQG